jgi:hypothetical protein
MVCTAESSHRHDCGSGCAGCDLLIPDRRTQAVRAISWSDQDRRVMSNWLPLNYQFAGFPVSGGIPSIFGTEKAAIVPLAVAAALVAFNLMDSILTARALSLGFTEANPVMAGLFEVSMPVGMFLKSAVVGLGALFLWRMRHLPMAVRGMTAVAACYGAVILYHLYFQLLVV